MRKYLGASVLTFFLVGAPIGSYLFLKSGYEHRLHSIEELKEKELSPELKTFLSLKLPTDGMAKLVHLPGADPQKEFDLLAQISEKIVDRNRFEIISYYTNADKLKTRRIRIDTSSAAIPSSEFEYLLIDTSGLVRNTYKLSAQTSKLLMRHLAVVIPVPKSRSIQLKRDLQNEN